MGVRLGVGVVRVGDGASGAACAAGASVGGGGGGVVGGVVVAGVVVVSEGRGRGGAPDRSDGAALASVGTVGWGWTGSWSGKSPVYGGGLEKTLVLVAESAHATFPGKLRGVVELADVWGLAGVEGFFKHFDDGALEGDDLALKLGLGEHLMMMSVRLYLLAERS